MNASSFAWGVLNGDYAITISFKPTENNNPFLNRPHGEPTAGNDNNPTSMPPPVTSEIPGMAIDIGEMGTLKLSEVASNTSLAEELRLISKSLGGVSNILLTAEGYNYTTEFRNGQISPYLYSYKMSGLIATMWATSELGTGYGILVAASFTAVDLGYSVGNWFSTNFSTGVSNFNNALNHGWVPGTGHH